jgi:prepilin-type N-terminal cleavage/methylation domain-containing protein
LQVCADRLRIRALQLKTLGSTRAFNMIEVLVALALLGFGLYASAEMVTSARRTSYLTQRRIQANSLAQLKLEELRCALATPNTPLPSDIPTSGTLTFEQNPKYAWRAMLNTQTGNSSITQLTIRVGPAGESLETTATALAQVHGILVQSGAATGGAQ